MDFCLNKALLSVHIDMNLSYKLYSLILTAAVFPADVCIHSEKEIKLGLIIIANWVNCVGSSTNYINLVPIRPVPIWPPQFT